MPTIIERSETSEQVIAVVRREDEMAVPPSDTQCRADANGDRCAEKISFNMTNLTFSQMCKEHDQQNEDARGNVEGIVKVLKFDLSKEVK